MFDSPQYLHSVRTLLGRWNLFIWSVSSSLSHNMATDVCPISELKLTSLSSIFSNILYRATFRRTATDNLTRKPRFTNRLVYVGFGVDKLAERKCFFEYRSLPVNIVLPTLTCYRLHPNNAPENLTTLFHSCVFTWLDLVSPVQVCITFIKWQIQTSSTAAV